MNRRASRWGIVFPFTAAVLSVVTYTLIRSARNLDHPFFEIYVSWIGTVLALFCFLVGHLSYPRIHNLKVYMAGYLLGLVTLAFYAVHAPPGGRGVIPAQRGFEDALYVVTFLNLVAVAVVPSFVKYHTTKIVTWTVTAVEAVMLALVAVTPIGEWFERLGLQWWIGPLAIAVVTALSLRYMRYEFHLGGLLSGCAIIYGLAWVVPRDPRLRAAAEPLVFALSVAFFEAGSIFHWFIRMEHRIAYDPLLHIYNRDFCSRILAEQSRLNVSPPFTIAMVDIDHFKRVNDTYGHQAGDQVLYAVAQALSRIVVPSGTLCRYGGEELVVFFPQQTTREVQQIMERARLAVQRMEVVSGRKHISVTVSCGICTRTDPGQTLQQVVAAADRALYRAKQNGRNQVRTASVRQNQKE